MSTTKTWPSGTTNSTPAPYSIPEIQDLNWANLSSFLGALADGAQATTFQRWSFQVVTTSSYTVGDSDCVIITDPLAITLVTVNLPPVTYKRIIIVTDGKGDAPTAPIEIVPDGTDTINNGSPFTTPLILNISYQSIVLIGDSDNNTWRTCLWASP